MYGEVPIALANLQFQELILTGTYLANDRKRWSRNFGPVVKVDRVMKEVIQNDEEKEPRARVQGQGCA